MFVVVCCLPYVSSLLPTSRPRFPNLARSFRSLARDFRFKCLCLELRVVFSNLSALDVNVIFVHVCILVLMGLLTASQPWVGLACSTCMCMQPLSIIIATLIITTLTSYHLIASSLAHISILYCSLSLSLSLPLSLASASASASALISLPSHQHINTSATHQQHISSTSAAHQHISTSAHQHDHISIISITSNWTPI